MHEKYRLCCSHRIPLEQQFPGDAMRAAKAVFYRPVFMHEKYRLCCSHRIPRELLFQRFGCRTWRFPSGTPVRHLARWTTFLRKLRLCGASLHGVKITFSSSKLAVTVITHRKLSSLIQYFLSLSDLAPAVSRPRDLQDTTHYFC